MAILHGSILLTSGVGRHLTTKKENAYSFSIVAALIVLLPMSYEQFVFKYSAAHNYAVPILSIYHVLQKGGLNISEGIDRRQVT